jgi:hypothetical protein
MPLSEDDIKKLKKRFDALDADAKFVRGVQNELEKYVVPYRGRMFQKDVSEGSVEWDKYDHYDDTAVTSASILSASIHGAVLPNLQWFYMRFKDDDIQGNNEFSNWLDDTAKRTYHAIDNSNFDLEADELIIDMTGFGHGFMVHESAGPDDEDLDFSMVPMKEALFQEGYKGAVQYFFRDLEWTAAKIVSKFGIDNVPDKIKDAYNKPTNIDQRFNIVFAIFPRDENMDADTSKPLASDARPWGHIYFMHEGMDICGEEGGYYENPVYSVPWRTVSGSQWGHGPGHVCLGDIKQLNQHRLMRTRAVEKAIDPANITTERGLMSNLDLGPRGLTVLRDIDSLKPYEGRANFSISTEEILMYKESIKSAFMIDRLEMKESPAMTATEVQVRYELMQRLLGPTMGRMKVQWLDRVVGNVFSIERRAGRLLPMPAGLEELNPEIVIEFVGALATSQKVQQANQLVQFGADIAQLSEPYPDLKYLINQDEFGRELAALKNIPEKIINGIDKAAQEKKDDAALIAKQQRMMEAQQQGQAMEAQGKGALAMQEAEAV